MDQDFPGKVTHCRYLNFFYLDRKAERGGGRHNNEQICQRQRKNPRQKLEKPKNVLRSETTNWYTASKITIRGDCLCFCIKRKPSFVHLIWQILVWWWLLFFEIWTPAWSSASTSRFHEGIFFFSWQNGTLSFFGSAFFFFFFCLFFLTKDFLPL